MFFMCFNHHIFLTKHPFIPGLFWLEVGRGGSILGGVGFLWVVVGSGRSISDGGWWWSILCMVVGLVGGDG